MLRDEYPLWLGGAERSSGQWIEVYDKYGPRGSQPVTRVARATPEMLEEAIAAAEQAAPACAALAPWERREILETCVAAFEERAEMLADLLCVEGGKPLVSARGEVARLIDTFRVASHECTRVGSGEVLPLAISERAQGYRGMWKRVPIGPCAFIAPFNFPLNLVAHKVAPAIAAGCPFVLKPASRTPVSAMLVGEVLASTAWPEGACSILPMRRDEADALTSDERFKLLSFTGSPAVGWELKAKAGKKKVVLELGGNAACVVDETAELDVAVPRIVAGAFGAAGQSCISVQRVLAHANVYDELRARLRDACAALVSGDPRDERCTVGPMIAESEAERLESWIREATDKGAKLVCGGSREGALHEASILEDVPRGLDIVDEEAFGPALVLSRFEGFDDALDEVNRSRFGLQAGVFTKDLGRAMRAWDRLEVGGVVIGDIPSWRVDHMPYGGVKDSGLGREGLRFAIEDMSELRMLVLRDS